MLLCATLQVRQALLVLLQHNCVTVHTLSPMADAAARLASYMYETDVPEILHRLRQALLLQKLLKGAL